MQEIQWSDYFSVKVEDVDEQHKTFINMIHQLNEDYKRNVEPERIQYVLLEMIIFARDHFKTEEDYMKKFGYPEYQSHESMHTEFMNEMLRFFKAYEEKPDDTIEKILDFLKSWFIDDHVLLADRRLGNFIYQRLGSEQSSK